VPSSLKLSDDARYLTVAAASTLRPSSTQQLVHKQQQQQLTAGYVFRVVAQVQSQAGFRYKLAGRLSLPVAAGVPGSGGLTGSAHVDMAADGQTFIACWTHSSQPTAADADAVAAGGGAGRAAEAQQAPAVSSGGAAVFTWRRQGQALQAAALAVPTGEASCTHF
jgi:hypothetical protein